VPVKRVALREGGPVGLGAVLLSSFPSPGNADQYDASMCILAARPLSAALAGALLGKRVVVKIGGGRGIGRSASSRTVRDG